MNRRRVAVIVVAMAALASACGQAHEDTRDMNRAIAVTENAPHVLRYTDDVDGDRVVVTLRVDDSFRSTETLSVNNVPLLEEIVSDDAAAVRLLSPDKWNPAAGTQLESILGSGKWVLDPAGAPPVFFGDKAQGAITDVGKDQLSDAQNALEYVRAVSALALGVAKFDVNNIFYRPSQDPFRDLVKSDEKAGIVRYDAFPPALPRTSQGGGNSNQPTRLPDSRFFRKLGVFVKNGKVVRVLEQIDFEHHEEILKAVKNGKPKFLLNELSALRRGVGENPIRQRRMTIDVVSVGRPVKIDLPVDAMKANLGALLRSQRFAQLPGIEKLGVRKQKLGAPYFVGY